MTSKAPPSTASTPWSSTGDTAAPISTGPIPPRPCTGWLPSPSCGRSSVSDGTVHVTFVCSGNICRSPMAEKMLAHQIEGRGLAERVRVTSAGTGGWHAGDGADHRTNAVLLAHGYPTTHRAAQLDEDHLAADMVVAMGRNHARMLADMGVPP